MLESKQNIDTFSENDLIFGLSYSDWTIRWCKWWCNSPKTHPPCAEADPITEKVFFLTTKSMKRFDSEILETNNNIPQDRAILFPVDKWFSLGFPFTETNVLKNTAKERIDNIPNISINIGGNILKPIRIQSDVFQLELKRDLLNPETPEKLKKIVKDKYKAVGEGYWIFLKPYSLKKGNHDMQEYASCKTGELS